MRRDLAPFYSSMGRPSIDPELMIRMLIIGYVLRYPLRAEALRRGRISIWRTGGSAGSGSRRCPRSFHLLEEPACRFRESDLLRRVFETVLQRCIAEGLVGGEGFAIDASLIKADANRQKRIEGEKGVAWPEATGPSFSRISGGWA